jgi:hypothetical protein
VIAREKEAKPLALKHRGDVEHELINQTLCQERVDQRLSTGH